MDDHGVRHPGRILKEDFLDPLGITPYRLAKGIGVHVRRVSELIKQNRRLTPDTAMRLSLFFSVPARWWLDMQADYDIANAENLEALQKTIRPLERPPNLLLSRTGVKQLDIWQNEASPLPSAEVSDDFLNKLRSQASIVKNREAREPRTVTYSNGATALVGGHG